MDAQQNKTDTVPEATQDKSKPTTSGTANEIPAPTSDQTNPHNQEPTGDWVANSRAADRKNNEPGLTDEERKRRRW